MKITLLLIGKTTDKHIDTLVDEYAARLRHYLSFDIKVIPELKNTKALTEAQQKEQEGALILKTIGATDRVILLDEHGTERRSVEFAAWLEKTVSSTGANVWFVVGGPYGFSADVYKRADDTVSLSKMTFSHQMVRLFFTEQLYRAMTILRHEPYHHE